MNWTRDWKNHTDQVIYEHLVGYKAVLCYARASLNQTMFSKFRPLGRAEQYVWLTPYQEQGGNFMLVGSSSMESFLTSRSDYMVPMVFDTREETYPILGTSYVTGFGTLTLPDGTIVQRGPRMYPYATAGIAALDWTSPTSKFIYGRNNPVSFDRSRLCVGLKGLVLSPEFRANHLIGPGVVPDTMFTDRDIDWRDAVAADVDTLSLLDEQAFPFATDEFTDGDISTRTTQITRQQCDDPIYADYDVPDGLCVEPMYRGIARIDWMREVQRSRGRMTWPQSRYDNETLVAGCGPMALTELEGSLSSARTNGMVFGYLSYKKIPRKQFPSADVYWGFDPYRFDHVGAKKAIRWALEYFGLQINQ